MIDARLSSLALALVPCFASAQEEASPQEVERGLRVRTEAATAGYTLFSPLASEETLLIDLDGEVVHRWEAGAPPGMAYLLPNGNLMRGARLEDAERFFGGGIGGLIQEFDWDGNLVWNYRLSDDSRCQHHDFEVMPNGNVLVILWEHVFAEDAVAMGRDPEVVAEGGFWPDAVLELEPVRPDGAKVVWEWHAWDHLVQDFDPDAAFYDVVGENAGKLDINADHRSEPPLTAEEIEEREALHDEMAALGYLGGDDEDEDLEEGAKSKEADWMHTNAIDYDPVHDLIALSSPELNEILILDHSTTTEEAAGDTGGRYGRGGEILYRWGNPQNYGAGSAADRALFYQHDVQWIAEGRPGAGHLILYNNGGGRPDGSYSSIVELALPFDAERGFERARGAPFGPREPAWEYTAPTKEDFFSGFISGCERLWSGNTLICSGAKGRLFEVTPGGEIVWDYWSPHGGDGSPSGNSPGIPPNAIFRALRYPPDYPAFEGREL